MKQEFKKFRSLLRYAIGSETQAKFAANAHLSPEHLNRMLNAETINRPSRSTLHKIASHAQNNVIYKMLEDALNQEDETYQAKTTDEILKDSKIKEAQYDFKPSFKEQADATFKHLSEYLQNDTGKYLITDTMAYMDHILSLVHKKYPNDLRISYEILDERENVLGESEMYANIEITVSDAFNSAVSEMIVYYDKTDHGHIIHYASMHLSDIMSLFGMPPYIIDSIVEDGKLDADTLKTLCELPYYCHMIKTETVPKYTSNKELLNVLLNPKTEYPETIPGIGFELKEIPETFCKFVEQHLYTVLEAYDDMPDIYAQMVKDIPGLLNNPKALAEYFDEMEYLDTNSLEEGWGAVISTIMTEETGIQFEYHKSIKPTDTQHHKDYTYPVNPHPVILIQKAELERNSVNRETLLNTICKFAHALRVEKFGNILFHHIKITDYIRKDMYAINYDKKEKPAKPKQDEQLRPDNEYMSFPENRPDNMGIYMAKLKDKRYMRLLYYPKENHWVRFQREWSDLIESYHPVPIETPND